ncbi:glycosyltransferase family 2 protein [Microbacterium sp. F2]|uniref:glycosyltransferase family 2 protein n=1 Tax=Microbacterium sp. F2 TaxID=3422228 RepID=UPI003FD102D1
MTVPASSFDVSVVIPCLNGGTLLAQQIAAVDRQETTASFEIVVADNGSSDGSTIAVRSQAWQHPLRIVDASAQRGINYARNAGVSGSSGRLILLCDHDDTVAEGWVAAYWEAYQEGAEIAGGLQMKSLATDAGRSIEDGSFGLNDSLGFLPWPTGANCALARSVFELLGGFNTNYRGGGDETEFFWRAQLSGIPLKFVESAVVHYRQRDTIGGLWVQKKAFGRSHVRLAAAFREQGCPSPGFARSFARVIFASIRLVAAALTARSTREPVGALAQNVGVLQELLVNVFAAPLRSGWRRS